VDSDDEGCQTDHRQKRGERVPDRDLTLLFGGFCPSGYLQVTLRLHASPRNPGARGLLHS
jgi:hypothetical protein